MEGLAGLVVPDYCCFALVCDPDAFDARAAVAFALEGVYGFFDAGFYRGDQFEGLVFVPSGNGTRLGLGRFLLAILAATTYPGLG